MSDEEFEACEDIASDLFLECQLGCNDTKNKSLAISSHASNSSSLIHS
jgi:hypothetical protein